MEPNHHPGKLPADQPEPKKWAGRKPSGEELRLILAEHGAWLEDGGRGDGPHDLREADLRRANLRRARLAGINLGGADLGGANLAGADLRGANLRGAKLNGARLVMADLSGTGLWRADLRGAALGGANLEKVFLAKADISGANLSGAGLQGADLREAGLRGAKLGKADLRGAGLSGADLQNANLGGANLGGANLERADLRGTDLRKADLSGADVAGVAFSRNTRFLGGRLARAQGSPRFLSFARRQEFLEDLRQTRGGRILYWPWLVLADCGRTPWPWIAWAVALCWLFALGFLHIEAAHPGSFHIPTGWGLDFWTFLYGSVTTFAGLGFGGMAPLTGEAAFWAAAEVAAGYVMLGGLISIFVSWLTRRS